MAVEDGTVIVAIVVSFVLGGVLFGLFGWAAAALTHPSKVHPDKDLGAAGIPGTDLEKRERLKVRQRSSLLKAVITAFPSVSVPFLAVPLRSHRTLVAISG
eukprot:SAG22_NODE_1150_length_5351_cov_3.848439_2_plen_101_part_00